MAFNAKEVFVNSLLELVKHKHLSSISLKEIIEKSEVSRQTFYNHFMDKNDLIQYVYTSFIIPDYDYKNMDINFKESLIVSLKNMERNKKFMKEACLYDGQNNLKDFIYEHCKIFDLRWHQSLYGSKPMSEALKFATIYHANASSSMILSWVLSDMPVSCEEMADMIVKMRSVGMDQLFKGGEHGNPYKD